MQQCSNKIIVIGDSGVGKTVFINKLRNEDFQPYHIPTKNVSPCIKTLNFSTSKGCVSFDVYDIVELDEKYYKGANGCIIMFDVSCPESYKNIPIWHNFVNKTCPGIPVVVCGNKIDRKENRKIMPKEIKLDTKYYDISVKNNYNIEKPFLYIIKKLYGENICLTIDDLPDYEEKKREKTAMEVVDDFKQKFSHRKIFIAICKYFMDHEDCGFASQGVKNTKLVVFAVDKAYKYFDNIIKRLGVDVNTIVVVQDE